jgi:hypothetical protein
MKRFLKWKLILPLLPLFIVASAIFGPLAENIIAVRAQPAPTITLHPTSGPPGTVVTVTGSGWTPNRLIDIRFGTSGPSTVTLTTASDGTFSTTVTIPSNAALGSSITISADLAGVTALATFTVTHAPTLPPPNFGEPHEPPSGELKGRGNPPIIITLTPEQAKRLHELGLILFLRGLCFLRIGAGGGGSCALTGSLNNQIELLCAINRVLGQPPADFCPPPRPLKQIVA